MTTTVELLNWRNLSIFLIKWFVVCSTISSRVEFKGHFLGIADISKRFGYRATAEEEEGTITLDEIRKTQEIIFCFVYFYQIQSISHNLFLST